MEGCSKTSAGAAASDLPDVLLVEILSRVPAKSVCRFKCVSKAWRDLIADPHHRKKLRQPMQGLFVQTYEESEADDDDLVRTSFDFINLSVGSVRLDIDPCFSFLTEMTGIEPFLLDSCNGLILFGQRQLSRPLDLDGYIVCNPTTRQWSAIPDCGSPVAYCRTFLAFDPAVSSHFHLVLLQMVDYYAKNIMLLHVYSSETGIWSQNQIYEHKEQGQLEGWLHQFELDVVKHCTYVNGFLHFIVCDKEDLQHILAVDIQGKAKKIITIPSMADGTFYLCQSQGHLHCVTLENEKVSTWVLQDYDTQEWVLKTTMNSLDGFGRNTHVVDIHQDCNVVFFFHHRGRELIAYSMHNKEASVVATFEKPISGAKFARYIPYFSESPSLTISTESMSSNYELAAWLNYSRLG